MRRTCYLLGLLGMLALPVGAQTPITRGPLPPTAKIAFDAPPEITTTAQALTFEARLNDNGTPLTAATQASGLTCAAGTPIVCQWALTASNRDALNQVGVHTLTLSLFRMDVGDSGGSAPFVLTSPAGAPRNLRILP